MKLQVTGKGERRSGTSSKNGRPYDGASIYGLVEEVGVQGKKAEEVYLNYLSGLAIPDINIGDLIDVEYNKQGFINAVTIAKKA